MNSIVEFKEVMISQFEMIDMGLMSYFLGIGVIQVGKGIFIFQKKYPSDILKKIKMGSRNPILTLVEEILKLGKYNSSEFVDPTNFRIRMIVSLWYLTFKRLDIVFGVGLVSRFMESPCQSHL